MSDVKHLIVTPEVAAALGKTEVVLADMTLRQFRELAFNKGFDVRVSGFDKSVPDSGCLTVKMDDERRPIVLEENGL